MRVLLVTTVYPPAIGGPSLQTRQIADGLLRRGMEPYVVAFGQAEASEQANGVTVQRLDPARAMVPGALGRQVYLYRRMLRIIDRVRPDVVHVQVLGPLGLATGLACRRRGVPALLKYSDDLVWTKLNRGRTRARTFFPGVFRAGLRARWFTRIQSVMLGVFARVWATSPFLEAQLREVFGLPDRRIFGFPNLVEVGRFEGAPLPRPRPAGAPVRVLTASRLQPWKGVETAIRAVARLAPGVATLRIVGTGRPHMRRHLEAVVRELGVEDRVELAGAVPPGEIVREFADADVFLLPTEYEPFGIVFVEAMAAGLPVLATRAGGVPSIVPQDEAGVLLEPRDVDGFAAALAALAADPGRRERMGRAGRARARRVYDLETRLDELTAVYREMLREAPRPARLSAAARPGSAA